jgi:hypothetical protein
MLITFFAETFLTELQTVNTFDAVLLQAAEKSPDPSFRSKLHSLLRAARSIHPDHPGGVLEKLGPHNKSPYLRFSCRLMVEFLVELPLNLIPLVGTPLFLMLQGYHLGPLVHYRYFQLVGLTKEEKEAFVRVNRWNYWLYVLFCFVIKMVLMW